MYINEHLKHKKFSIEFEGYKTQEYIEVLMHGEFVKKYSELERASLLTACKILELADSLCRQYNWTEGLR